MPNNQTPNYAPLEQSLNWIGDKLLDVRNAVTFDLGTQRLINGMNVTENYKLIYEKLNTGTGSEILKKIEFVDGKLIANDNFKTHFAFTNKIIQRAL